MECSGTESRLIDCQNSGIGNHNCVHSEDAGVTCLSSVTPTGSGSGGGPDSGDGSGVGSGAGRSQLSVILLYDSVILSLQACIMYNGLWNCIHMYMQV